MKLIQPNCRAKFQSEDIDFIVSVLGRSGGDGAAGCLVQLLSDEEDRDRILDDPALLYALLETGGCLRVSTRFYFYILVRHTLRRTGVEDRTLADYVAEMLSEFARSERTGIVLPGGTQSLEYFFEMLAALRTTDERSEFSMRTHMGNYALFLSGVFPERIEARAQSRGFPGLSYYRQLGMSQFRAAGEHKLARRYQLELVLHTLSEEFERTRHALHDIAERLFTFGEN